MPNNESPVVQFTHLGLDKTNPSLEGNGFKVTIIYGPDGPMALFERNGDKWKIDPKSFEHLVNLLNV